MGLVIENAGFVSLFKIGRDSARVRGREREGRGRSGKWKRSGRERGERGERSDERRESSVNKTMSAAMKTWPITTPRYHS